MAYFKLKKTKNQQYMFNLVADNGEVTLTSETYTRRSGARNGISSVKTNAPTDSRYDRRTSGKQFYFVLQAANSKVIGTSERYTRSQSMERGIASVKREAPDAPVRDLTS